MFGLIALLSLAACTSHPRSAAPVTGARTSATAGPLSWVRRTYYGAGLGVTLTQPARWTAPSCSPRFYGATLAYLANFPLRRFCRSTPASMTCDHGGSVPTPPEVSWSPSLSGLRPGPVSKSQLFAGGSPVFAGSRRAVSRPFDVADCLGRGADHAVDYTIDDRQAAGAVGLVICWRGRSPVLAQEVKDTVQGLRIAPDPGTACRTGTEPRTVLRAHAP
jgi:hypothetical protein